MPGALRRVRIFTPAHEMPFAGHPTVGAAFVLAATGVIPLDGAAVTVTLQLNIGPTPVTLTARGGRPAFVWMEQPAARFGRAWRNAAEVTGAFGLKAADLDRAAPVQVVSTGVPYLLVPLRSLAVVRRAAPAGEKLVRVGAKHRGPVALAFYLFTRQTEGRGHTVHARMFSPPPDLPEDAATGSAAGPLAAYLARHTLAAGEIIIEQGYEMQRPALIHAEALPTGRVRVGGECVIVGEGVIHLP
jgi:trans-2,3-dihydro-3-hydroxyanthranilate isomerase